MDEIRDVRVPDVASVGVDVRDCVRETKNGDFVSRVGNVVVGSGAPTGHAPMFRRYPALETPGYFQLSLRHKGEGYIGISGCHVRPRGLKPWRRFASDAALEGPLFHGCAEPRSNCRDGQR